MSSSDPMIFAAQAGGMSDSQLFDIFHELQTGDALSDFQQAVLDEAHVRGILSASEVGAITGPGM